MDTIVRLYQKIIKKPISEAVYKILMKIQSLKNRFKYYLIKRSVLEKHFNSFNESYKMMFLKDFLFSIFKSKDEMDKFFYHHVSINSITIQDYQYVMKCL